MEGLYGFDGGFLGKGKKKSSKKGGKKKAAKSRRRRRPRVKSKRADARVCTNSARALSAGYVREVQRLRPQHDPRVVRLGRTATT